MQHLQDEVSWKQQQQQAAAALTESETVTGLSLCTQISTLLGLRTYPLAHPLFTFLPVQWSGVGWRITWGVGVGEGVGGVGWGEEV